MANALTSSLVPLRHRTFRILWLAQLGSNIGVWMQTVGAQWFLVGRGSGSALVAWVQTASALPALLLSLLAGVLADAYDRRKVILITTALSTAGGVALTVMSMTNVLNPAWLLVWTFFIGASSALTSPAWQAIQPELVSREEIPAAAGLGGVTVNAARAIGPAVAGLLVAATGPWLVFAINALSFVGVIAAMIWWKRPTDASPADERERFGPAILAGLRYIRSGPVIRRILLRAGMFAFPASALWALLPVVAADRFNYGALGYGVMLALLGVGALAGVLLVPVARGRWSDNAVLAGAAVLFAAGTVALVWAPAWAVLIMLVAAGIAWIGSLTTVNSGMQVSLAPWVRARGMAVYLLVFMGAQAVGSFIWGAASDAIGAGTTLLVAAGMLVLVALSVLILPLHADTGRLSRATVAYPVPSLVFDPDPTDGPVLVVNDYRIHSHDAARFTAAMYQVGRSRQRTGASRWALYRAGDADDMYREQFVVRSWSELLQQSRVRWLASDQQNLDEALACIDGEPERHHYMSARDPG